MAFFNSTGNAFRFANTLLLSFAAVFSHQVKASISRPVVQTQEGPVQGIRDSLTQKYLGIPYAVAPTGSKRWLPPQPLQSRHAVLDASTPGPACAQRLDLIGPESNQEDCLYLNVYAPAVVLKKLPVIVWIHGGGFLNGYGADYDGSALSTEGRVIVVSINYRLGIFGFLSHPALEAESVTNEAGNYGLMDQQAALRWVRHNIASFGGDPDKVTIAGESAGGFSVLSHLVSPKAAGLFHRAIIQSGGYRLTLPTAEQANAVGQSLANSLGCKSSGISVTDCLRALSPDVLLKAQYSMMNNATTSGLAWGPRVSREILPDQPRAALNKGNVNVVPLLIGSNGQEGRLFVANSYDLKAGPVTEANYGQVIKGVYGIASPLVSSKYPLKSYANADLAFATVFGDSGLSCQGHIWGKSFSRKLTTYFYEFNDQDAPQIFLPPIGSFKYGPTHGSELPYLFPAMTGHKYMQGVAVLSPDQQQLAKTMRHQWTQFAYFGKPDGGYLPLWSNFTSANTRILSFELPKPTVRNDFYERHKCSLWVPLLELTTILPTSLTGAAQ